MLQQLTLVALLLGIYGVLAHAVDVKESTKVEDEAYGYCSSRILVQEEAGVWQCWMPTRIFVPVKKKLRGMPPGYWCRRSDLVVDREINPEDCAEELVAVIQ